MDNCVNATRTLLHWLWVKHTKSFLEDQVLGHPNHPSLLSITDTLDQYNIEHLALQTDFEKLVQAPLPAIVQFKHGQDGIFKVVSQIDDRNVTLHDNIKHKEIIPINDFKKQWTGITLLCELNENVAEPGIKKRQKKRNRKYAAIGLIAFLLITLTTFSFYNSVTANSFTSSWVSLAAISVLKILGIVVSSFLLWFEVDQYNPTLQQICSTGKKVNCNAVLQSKYAKFLDGTLSLSSIGFSYFFGTLLCLVLTNFSSGALTIVGFLSFLAAPAVLFSLYQQAFVIKQWCKLCVFAQLILIAEIIVVSTMGLTFSDTGLYPIILLSLLVAIALTAWQFAKPLIEAKKKAVRSGQNLSKIKNKSEVFFSILNQGNTILHSTNGLGIEFTNENAKHHVVKVCNPYCGPCSKAHPVLDELYTKGLINLQIIFTADPEKNERMAKPVSHLMAVLEKDKAQIHHALDDWYNASTKDYDVFAAKYPMNGELKQQKDHLVAMANWCQEQQIKHTPTIFINGKELPTEYTVDELEMVLQ